MNVAGSKYEGCDNEVIRARTHQVRQDGQPDAHSTVL
jgi:hypothetical protein